MLTGLFLVVESVLYYPYYPRTRMLLRQFRKQRSTGKTRIMFFFFYKKFVFVTDIYFFAYFRTIFCLKKFAL